MSSIMAVISRWRGIVECPENQLRNVNAHMMLRHVDWHMLTVTASMHHGGVPCKLLAPFTLGAHHMIRAIEFENGDYWIARLAMGCLPIDGIDAVRDADAIMVREFDTISLIKEKTSVPVPGVFAYIEGNQNSIGAPTMFQEFCLGNAMMDLNFDIIPPAHKTKLFEQIADAQVELAGLKFNKIGSISRDAQGNFTVGPLPDIGGPFDTMVDYFQAYFEVHHYRRTFDEMRNSCNTEYEYHTLMRSIAMFPNQIPAFVEQHFGRYNHGPFLLKHVDLGQNNIVVDDQYNLMGFVDWEGAFAAPLVLIEMPKLLSIVPKVMRTVRRGLPLGVNEGDRLADRARYASAIRLAERDQDVAPFLSQILTNVVLQDVGAAIRMYIDPGVVGFFDYVFDVDWLNIEVEPQ